MLKDAISGRQKFAVELWICWKSWRALRSWRGIVFFDAPLFRQNSGHFCYFVLVFLNFCC